MTASPQEPAHATTVRTLTFAGASAALAAAHRRATELGVAVCITIADRAGEPVLAGRMDGAPLLSARIAADKAWTVTAFNGLPTEAWWGMIKDDPALVHGITHTPRLTIFGGGVPIYLAGELVGAVGVSGGSAEQDADIAAAAAAALS